MTASPFVYRPPSWGTGMITEADARFLHDLILEVRPSVAIELGVASGCSSVTILEAMRHSRIPDPGSLIPETWLHAFDISERCYFDSSRPTGHAVHEMTPWNVPHYRIIVGDALTARERLVGLNARFAFVDANHLHPWATVDLLALLPAMAPSAWVALHDIRLPFMTGRRDPRGFGPHYLFERWPFEKRQGGTEGNIGAIRLPGDLQQSVSAAQSTLLDPWEAVLPDHVCTALSIAARPPGVAARREALRAIAKAAARRRPIYVCGSGEAGRQLVGELNRHDVGVTAFADLHTSQGRVVDGLPVLCRHQLSRSSAPRPFLALTRRRVMQIDAELIAGGWKRGTDFVVVW